MKGNGQTVVVMPKGRRGIFTLKVLKQSYEIGSDFVFLLQAYNQPVILRSLPGTNSYSVVSTCILGYGPSPKETTWLRPWNHPVAMKTKITFSKLSQSHGVLSAFLESLLQLCEAYPSVTEAHLPEASPNSTAMFLDFWMVPLSGLDRIEAKLHEHWLRLEHRLGWMTLDQTAMWFLLHHLEEDTQEVSSGEEMVSLDEVSLQQLESFCGEYQMTTSYGWNIRHFCWSFIRRPEQRIAASNPVFNPVYTQLKSQLPMFREWAQVSEQLFTLIEFSQSVLSKSWTRFPGSELPAQWRDNWHSFCECRTSAPTSDQSQELPPDCTWNWSKFKSALKIRRDLWTQKIPRQIDPSSNVCMASHLGLRSLGLDLVREERVMIE